MLREGKGREEMQRRNYKGMEKKELYKEDLKDEGANMEEWLELLEVEKIPGNKGNKGNRNINDRLGSVTLGSRLCGSAPTLCQESCRMKRGRLSL